MVALQQRKSAIGFLNLTRQANFIIVTNFLAVKHYLGLKFIPSALHHLDYFLPLIVSLLAIAKDVLGLSAERALDLSKKQSLFSAVISFK